MGDVPRWSAAGYAVFAFSAGKKAFAKRQPRLLVVNAPKNGYLFEEHGLHSLQIVHNDAALVEGIAVCGTRGWFFDAEEDADKK